MAPSHFRRRPPASLAERRNSVSYHLEVGSLDHTLTAEEATENRGAIIEGMQARGYELRIGTPAPGRES